MDRDIRESLVKRGSLSLLRGARANPNEADPARDLLQQLGYKQERVERALKPYKSRHVEYVVYPDASHRHAERAVRVPSRRGKGPYDLTDAKHVAKAMGPPAAIYSVSKGRFVGWIHPNGRYVPFR